MGDDVKKCDPIRNTATKVNRNNPCPCGSGAKFKRCCLRSDPILFAKIQETIKEILAPNIRFPRSSELMNWVSDMAARLSVKEQGELKEQYDAALAKAISQRNAFDAWAGEMDAMASAKRRELGRELTSTEFREIAIQAAESLSEEDRCCLPANLPV